MKIGVYLGFDPYTRLTTEGLGRYIGGLIKGFTDKGDIVKLAIPEWLEDSVIELCEEFDIDRNQLELNIMHRLPFIWGIYSFLYKKKKPKKQGIGLKTRIKYASKSLTEKSMDVLVTSSNMMLFIALLLLMCIGGIACVALCVMLAAAFFVILIGMGLIMAIPLLVIAIVFKKKDLIKRKSRKIYKLIAEFVGLLKGTKGFILQYKRSIYLKMLSETRKLLAKESNKMDVDVWFISTLFWPETNKLTKPRVNVVPDVVSQVYSYDFAGLDGTADTIKLCRETIDGGKYFITYCNYINESVLKKTFYKYNGVSIPHVNNALDRWLEIDKSFSQKLNIKYDLSKKYAYKLLRTLPLGRLATPESYGNFSFDNVRYIFYPSQVRPYKNITNLIKAHRELIVHYNEDIKLVLTCNPVNLKEDAKEFIRINKMEHDIMFFTGVSIQHLAALYKCAELVVNPTLYEGGFLFTFGEGMSVGTPSIMGDIPQTTDILKDYENIMQNAVFDPYSVDDMARKIKWGLDNREKLYEYELPLYNKLAERTSEIVADDYVAYFKKVVEMETACAC